MDIDGVRKMFKGLKGRWLKNYLGYVIIILLCFELIFIVSIKKYYYESVKQNVLSRATVLTGFYNKYISVNVSSEDFMAGAVKLVDKYGEKDVYEIQLLNTNGDVIISSSGFIPELKIKTKDFQDSLKGNNGVWYGKDSTTQEKVMAVSSPILKWNGEIEGVLRLITSLNEIDKSIFIIFLISLLISAAIITFVILSGQYFIRSIINPLSEINGIAKEMAKGKFNIRIEKKYNDEIGELSDNLNYMADEIIKAEKLKNDFISSISHELRTPLTSIKGWSETILSGSIENKAETEKGLNVIVKESARLSKMVEELLDFSRMESGRFSLHMEKVEVLNEFEDIVFIFKQRAKNEGIILEYDYTDNIPWIIGDKNRLRQVFVNILDNAVKFSESESKIIASIDADNENVYIKVQDFGAGIPEDELNKVKEKFYKGSSQKRGSGIGLAVSDEIVRMHGGRIDIESKMGIGTTIKIILPLQEKN